MRSLLQLKPVLRRLLQIAAVAAIVGGTTMAVGQTLDDLLLPPPESWPQHGRTPDAQRYSPLEQINVENVSRLRMAWSRALGFDGRVQGGPAVWGDTMFVSTATGLIALGAASGEMIWQYDGGPGEPTAVVPLRAARGSPVVYDGKVFTTLREPVVVALDALTGEEEWRTDVGAAELAEGFTTNPIFAEGKIIAGPTGADFGGAPGRVLALDADDGEIVWSFNVVPLDPDDPAIGSWEPVAPSWRAGVGGASAWNAGAYDPISRTVIYGTGQPIPSDRLDRRRGNEGEPSADLYSASFVALHVDTGVLAWHHQVVPGDEWEYDQHTVPIVADVMLESGPRRVAILATSTGYIVLIDVMTGEFLLAHRLMEETTVHLGYEDDGAAIIDPSMRYLGEGSPKRVCPGTRWAHIAPGAYSPDTGLLYRPNDTVCLRRGAQVLPDDWQPGMQAFWLHAEPRQSDDYFDRWGALTAIDPLTGRVAWEFSLGYPHDAGAIATAGGLVFSAFADRTFRAFDARTGEVLWQQVLTAHSDGSAITYQVGAVQYVAVMAGRERGVSAIPALDLPMTVPGGPALFVFALF